VSTVASLAFVGGSHSGETGARISTLLQVTSGNLFDTYRFLIRGIVFSHDPTFTVREYNSLKLK
jgi:hypothetical protein